MRALSYLKEGNDEFPGDKSLLDSLLEPYKNQEAIK